MSCLVGARTEQYCQAPQVPCASWISPSSWRFPGPTSPKYAQPLLMELGHVCDRNSYTAKCMCTACLQYMPSNCANSHALHCAHAPTFHSQHFTPLFQLLCTFRVFRPSFCTCEIHASERLAAHVYMTEHAQMPCALIPLCHVACRWTSWQWLWRCA